MTATSQRYATHSFEKDQQQLALELARLAKSQFQIHQNQWLSDCAITT